MGTAVRKVILLRVDEVWGRNGAARRVQTASVLKGNMNSMEEPARIGVTMALTVPWMWCRGRRWRSRSCGV